MERGKVIQISLERYTELIRKETMYDKFMEDKEMNIYVGIKPEKIKWGAK